MTLNVYGPPPVCDWACPKDLGQPLADWSLNINEVTYQSVAEGMVTIYRHFLCQVYLNTFMTSQIGKYLMGKISTASDFHDKFVCQIKLNLALY